MIADQIVTKIFIPPLMSCHWGGIWVQIDQHPNPSTGQFLRVKLDMEIGEIAVILLRPPYFTISLKVQATAITVTEVIQALFHESHMFYYATRCCVMIMNHLTYSTMLAPFHNERPKLDAKCCNKMDYLINWSHCASLLSYVWRNTYSRCRLYAGVILGFASFVKPFSINNFSVTSISEEVGLHSYVCINYTMYVCAQIIVLKDIIDYFMIFPIARTVRNACF